MSDPPAAAPAPRLGDDDSSHQPPNKKQKKKEKLKVAWEGSLKFPLGVLALERDARTEVGLPSQLHGVLWTHRCASTGSVISRANSITASTCTIGTGRGEGKAL